MKVYLVYENHSDGHSYVKAIYDEEIRALDVVKVMNEMDRSRDKWFVYEWIVNEPGSGKVVRG